MGFTGRSEDRTETVRPLRRESYVCVHHLLEGRVEEELRVGDRLGRVARPGNGEVTLLGRTSGPALGLLDHCLYAEERHELHPGDVLVFMTDGILEAIESDLVTMPTLRALLAHAPAGSRAVHDAILDWLRVYGANRRADDRTLISVELLEQEETRLAS